MKKQWSTSHSTSLSRTNALIKVELLQNNRDQKNSDDHQPYVGYGEVGLPPKNPQAGYCADYDDVEIFVRQFSKHYSDDLNKHKLNNETLSTSKDEILLQLLRLLDEFADGKTRGKDTFGRCGIEMAILDLQHQISAQPIQPLLQTMKPKPAFFTIGLDETTIMQEETLRCLEKTKFLKIKLNGDFQQSMQRFKAIVKTCQKQTQREAVYLCVDANASWTPEMCITFYSFLEEEALISPIPATELLKEQSELLQEKSELLQEKSELLQEKSKLSQGKSELSHPAERTGQNSPKRTLSLVRFVMLEQPFPTTGPLLEQWKDVLALYSKRGILLIADESIAVSDDLEILKPYVNGVNIKMEKVGGFRNGCRLAQKAHEMELFVWVGMMVGSALNCWQAVQLLPYAVASDLDGFLLVTPDSQSFPIPRFHWDDHLGTVSAQDLFK